MHYSEAKRKMAILPAGLFLILVIMGIAFAIYHERPDLVNGLSVGMGIGFFIAYLLPGGFLARYTMIPDEEPKAVQPQPQKLIEYVTDKAWS